MNSTIQFTTRDKKIVFLTVPAHTGAFTVVEKFTRDANGVASSEIFVGFALCLVGDANVDVAYHTAAKEYPNLSWSQFEPNNRVRGGARQTQRYTGYTVLVKDGKLSVDHEALGDYASSFAAGGGSGVEGPAMTLEQATTFLKELASTARAEAAQKQ